VETPRKPARVATETRLDVRVTLDPHMGAIYTRLAAVPGRLRGRELLALARLAVGQGDAGRVPAPMPAAPISQAIPARDGDAGTEPGAGLEHLGGFADATPPLH
jgi:hypothetical protein